MFRAAQIIRIKSGLQYRVSASAGMATQFFWGWMLIMIYSAFYANANQNQQSLSAIIAYVWLQQAFLHAVALWIIDAELADIIRSGQIAYELARPQDLYRLRAACCFWTVEGLEVTNILSDGGRTAMQYPLSIYNKAF